jgi:hypothetical protein
LVVDQVIVEAEPRVIDVGEAAMLIVGAGVGKVVTVTVVDWFALPPAPVQVRV